MTRVRLTATLVVALTGLAGVAPAAPVPKDAGKNNPTPQLGAIFEVVEGAVKGGRRPRADDEDLLRGSARIAFDRALKAAEMKPRLLAALEFKERKRLDPAKAFKGDADDGFVVARDVKVRATVNAVIFASGEVDVSIATDCVIFARRFRCGIADNCLIVASESIEVSSAWRLPDGDGSVLIAGNSIRAALMDGTVCHVVRPVKAPAKGDGGEPEVPESPIRVGVARRVTFLNEKADTMVTEQVKDCKYLPQKTPVVK